MNNSLPVAHPGGQSPSSPLTANPWFVAGVFGLFTMLSFADRQIIGLLVEPIKSELRLSDVQLSLVGGLSFVVFYVTFGLPLGRMADKHNRKRIVIVGVLIWSIATMLCALATQFWQLLLLRMGVGLGEAALAPCAYSILAQIFPRQRLATALSVCTMAGAVGMGFAYFGGGLLLHWATSAASTAGTVSVPLLGELTPWRVVFLSAGLPGVIFSALLLAVREPQRGSATGQHVAVRLSQVIAYLRANSTTFITHNVGMGLIAMTGYTASFWDIAFFERTYGWTAASSGRPYGLLAMAGSVIGALTGGWLADHLSAKRMRDSKILVLVGAALIGIPIRFLYPLMPSQELALALAFVGIVIVGIPFGVAAAALQLMTPLRMRGQLTAVYFFVQSLIGLGLGPTIAGMLTDYGYQNPLMLRYSMVITGGAAQILAAILFAGALGPYQATLIRAQEFERTEG